MPATNPKVDAYIAKSAEFAQPILKHIRKLVHEACPDAEEKIKWGFPHFDHKGMMCSMAAFKEHCALTFWKGTIMKDPHQVMTRVGETAMGQFGRITSIEDLPEASILMDYIKEAKQLNDDDVKLPARKKPSEKKELVVPDYFMSELAKHQEALAVFEKFSYSHKKEYVEWVTEARRETTRANRIEKAIALMLDHKSLNWKYEKKK